MCGHYPVFSVGSHGDTDELQENLLPLLEAYGVDVYFSGHDHLSAHLRLMLFSLLVSRIGDLYFPADIMEWTILSREGAA